MSGPWEDFRPQKAASPQVADDGPWMDFKPAAKPAPDVDPQASYWDQFKTGAERQWGDFKTGLGIIAAHPGRAALEVGPIKWARDIAKDATSAVKLPMDVATGKVPMPQTFANGPSVHTKVGEDPQDELIGRSLTAATLASPVNPAVRAGDFAIPAGRAVTTPGEALPSTSRSMVPAGTPPGPPRPDVTSFEPRLNLEKVKPVPPTGEALKAEGGRGYDLGREMGVDYSSKAVADHAMGLQMGLEKDGLIPVIAPKTHAIIQGLTSPPPGSVAPLQGIDAARRALREVSQNFHPDAASDRKAAGLAIRALDEFVDRAGTPSGAGAVVAGPAAEAAKTWKDARGNYAAGMRSSKLTGIEDTAELRAAIANSGQNFDNTLRQRIAALLQNPKLASGFTPEELAALKKTAIGELPANAARATGNVLGGGGGLGAAVTSGIAGSAGAFMTGSPWGALAAGAPVVGNISKRIANALTGSNLKRVDEMVRRRSPMYEEMLQSAPMQAASPEKRAAIAKILMITGGAAPREGHR